ncbi:unnamed protein product, partial [Rotaria sordida]
MHSGCFLCVILAFSTVFFLVNCIDVQSEIQCDPSAGGPCSEKPYCWCASLITGGGICTIGIRCAAAISCDANNPCQEMNSTCVFDNRCGAG